jgi:LacI family transcriptional regulator
MRITIEDVAREAEVSIATVSRFLNGREGQMSAATRERIREVVDRLGYMPDAAARSLKTRRSRMIGVALAEIGHVYWSGVLAGIEQVCLQQGYGVMISSAGNDPAAQRDAVSVFANQRVEGVLLNPTRPDASGPSAWEMLECPVIMLDRTMPHLPYPLVAVDGRRGVRTGVDHLAALGHREIGFIGWEIAGLSNRQERLDGYLEAMAAHGLPVRPGYLRLGRESWNDGVRETIDLLTGSPRPTAIVSATMELNLQALAAIKHLGLRAPEDVSLVGFDAAPWDDLLDPPLTTISAPPVEIGRTAADLLIGWIEGGAPGGRKDHLIVPELAVRRSTAPIRPLVD